MIWRKGIVTKISGSPVTLSARSLQLLRDSTNQPSETSVRIEMIMMTNELRKKMKKKTTTMMI